MFGLTLAELVVMLGILCVVASAVIGMVYVGVRLAIRHERKRSN